MKSPFAVIPLLLLLGITSLTHAQVTVSPYVLSAGAVQIDHGGIQLTGTLGEPLATTTSLGSLELRGGFWAQLAQTTPITHEPVAAGPTEFRLHSAYPNPFNPEATISFDLPRSAPVALEVHDALGRRVTTLHSGDLARGTHAFRWNASEHASGRYFVTLSVPGWRATQPLTLLK